MKIYFWETMRVITFLLAIYFILVAVYKGYKKEHAQKKKVANTKEIQDLEDYVDIREEALASTVLLHDDTMKLTQEEL